jgi:hypothetical protein
MVWVILEEELGHILNGQNPLFGWDFFHEGLHQRGLPRARFPCHHDDLLRLHRQPEKLTVRFLLMRRSLSRSLVGSLNEKAMVATQRVSSPGRLSSTYLVILEKRTVPVVGEVGTTL